MAEPSVLTRPDRARSAPDHAPAPVDGGRVLRRRQALPGGRAVVGGFLVAVAAVGIFAAYTDATADRRQRYVVATRELALGDRVSRADLGWVPMDLPPGLQARSFRQASRLVGAVVVGPVARGELVQASDVMLSAAGGLDAGQQVSFPLDAARAVDGRLVPGELVDVLATYGTGDAAYTVVVVRSARVVSHRHPGGTLTDGRGDVVTVAVRTPAEALAVVHAASAGAVTLVRAPLSPAPLPGATAEPGTYRAPGAGPARR